MRRALFFAAMAAIGAAVAGCGGIPPEDTADASEPAPDAAPDATPQTLWDVSTWDDPVAVWGP